MAPAAPIRLEHPRGTGRAARAVDGRGFLQSSPLQSRVQDGRSTEVFLASCLEAEPAAIVPRLEVLGETCATSAKVAISLARALCRDRGSVSPKPAVDSSLPVLPAQNLPQARRVRPSTSSASHSAGHAPGPSVRLVGSAPSPTIEDLVAGKTGPFDESTLLDHDPWIGELLTAIAVGRERRRRLLVAVAASPHRHAVHERLRFSPPPVTAAVPVRAAAWRSLGRPGAKGPRPPSCEAPGLVVGRQLSPKVRKRNPNPGGVAQGTGGGDRLRKASRVSASAHHVGKVAIPGTPKFASIGVGDRSKRPAKNQPPQIPTSMAPELCVF